MITMPIAGGLPAVAVPAGATGCTASAHTAQAEAPTATAAPKHPTETLPPCSGRPCRT
ncbi:MULTISPECIES: hypothetical protein [unclassified Streptomyces]|uniref:hypothetical protein n=1 Tax=unclassified Streptomyces TaxID=2593676 RepID=UPI0035E01334